MPDRLVIRVKLPPRETPQAPAPRRSSRNALLLILGAVAVVLSVVGLSVFRTETRTPAPVATEAAPQPEPQSAAVVTAPSEPAPAVSDATPAKTEPAAAPSATREVIPDVPRSALNTISGTIRVSIRVIVDQNGTVLAATADEPGPSRYFERLALAAAKKWTFGPDPSPEQRVMLVRFNFKRSGVTARSNSVQ